MSSRSSIINDAVGDSFFKFNGLLLPALVENAR